MSLTRNKENADDVLQQTLIKAYQKWSGFEYNSTLHCRAWAATILRHEFLNLCRENRYHINISLNLHELDNYLNYKRPLVLGSNRKPDQVLMYKSFLDDIEEEVGKLPDYQRIIMEFYLLEDRPYAEIAEILNVSINTVKSRIRRARQALRESLGAYGPKVRNSK